MVLWNLNGTSGGDDFRVGCMINPEVWFGLKKHKTFSSILLPELISLILPLVEGPVEQRMNCRSALFYDGDSFYQRKFNMELNNNNHHPAARNLLGYWIQTFLDCKTKNIELSAWSKLLYLASMTNYGKRLCDRSCQGSLETLRDS